MEIKNPSHPGEILEVLYLEPLGLTITEVAQGLGYSRKTVSDLVHGHRSVTLDMALRLAKAFDTRAELWLDLQSQYDCAQAKLRTDTQSVLENVKVLYRRNAQPPIA